MREQRIRRVPVIDDERRARRHRLAGRPRARRAAPRGGPQARRRLRARRRSYAGRHLRARPARVRARRLRPRRANALLIYSGLACAISAPRFQEAATRIAAAVHAPLSTAERNLHSAAPRMSTPGPANSDSSLRARTRSRVPAGILACSASTSSSASRFRSSSIARTPSCWRSCTRRKKAQRSLASPRSSPACSPSSRTLRGATNAVPPAGNRL